MKRLRKFWVVVCTLMNIAVAQEWNMYLHDPPHTSYVASGTSIDPSTLTTLQPAWTLSIQHIVAAAATVSNGVLYVGDWKGNFYAIRADDGTILWQQFVGVSAAPPDPVCQPATGVSAQATVAGKVVYVAGGDSALYALDIDTGNQLWRVPLADPATGAYLWSSLTLFNNSLYVGIASLGDCPLARGALVRIDLDHPEKPIFHYLVPAGEIGGGIWSTPAIDAASNTVFVTTGTGEQDAKRGLWGGTMLALDATTLDVKSYFFLPTNSTTDDIEWGSSPTLFQYEDGAKLVTATGKDGNLYCVSREKLTPVWTRRVAISCDCPQCGCGSLATPAFDGNRLYVGAGTNDENAMNTGAVYAIEPSSGEVLWRQGLPGVVIAPVTVANGIVFASTATGLVALDTNTGNPLWDDGGYGMLYSQPIVSGDTIYSTYVSGDVIAWRLPPSSAGGQKSKRASASR